MSDYSSNKTLIIILCALVALWSVLTMIDIAKRAQAGYYTDGNNTITRVFEGSPAAAAGLQVGDFITRINGISTENHAELLEMGRAEIGETRVFTFDRDGETLDLSVTFGKLTERDRMLSYAAVLIGLCYLGFCVTAFLGRQNRATQVLAVMGLGIGLAFLGGPYFASAGFRSIANTLRNAMVLAGIAALLHFLLVFPRPRAFIERPNGFKLLYTPVVIFWLLISYRNLFTPAASSALNTFTNLFAGLLIGGYCLLAIITLLRAWIGTDSEARASSGLGVMLWGTVIGLAPVGLANIIGAVSPQTVLPGSDFYFMTLILIPLSWSMAARKQAESMKMAPRE